MISDRKDGEDFSNNPQKKYIFEPITDREKAKAVLDSFATSLESLKRGEEFRSQMAEKFIEYGNLLGIKSGEEFVGFGAFYDNDQITREAFLSMIAIKEAYRGLGVGSVLLKEISSLAKKQGMESIKLEVNKGNEKAISFYQQKQFVVVSKTDNSYIMQKSL